MSRFLSLNIGCGCYNAVHISTTISSLTITQMYFR